jgi:hypothetical protein
MIQYCRLALTLQFPRPLTAHQAGQLKVYENHKIRDPRRCADSSSHRSTERNPGMVVVDVANSSSRDVPFVLAFAAPASQRSSAVQGCGASRFVKHSVLGPCSHVASVRML